MDISYRNHAHILDKLIQVNNDRIEGYKTAIGLLSDSEVHTQSAFERYRDQSMQFRNELIPLVAKMGQASEEGMRNTRKLLRVWLDIKTKVPNATIQAVLDSCVIGEEECKKVYTDALENLNAIDNTILVIVDSQSLLQAEALIHVRELRNKSMEE